MSELEENKDNQEYLEKHLIKIEYLFKDETGIIFDDKKMEQFLNGVKIVCSLNDGICKIYNKDKKFVGIAEVRDKKLKRDVIV